MGGPLPGALLALALGLALAFAPLGTAWRALPVFAVPAILLSLVPTAGSLAPATLLACWVSVVVTAAAVHLPGGVRALPAFCLAANAGVWTGLVVAGTGSPLNLLVTVPAVLLFVPGSWLVRRGLGLGVKVVASWLVAIAVLGAALPFAPTLLGYEADHLE